MRAVVVARGLRFAVRKPEQAAWEGARGEVRRDGKVTVPGFVSYMCTGGISLPSESVLLQHGAHGLGLRSPLRLALGDGAEEVCGREEAALSFGKVQRGREFRRWRKGGNVRSVGERGGAA